jgi:ATP-binding cassette subfamily B protein
VLWFVGLCAVELLFGRVISAVQLRIGPRQRHYLSRMLFHYLQRHSQRFLTENFAGALAHRISETAQGVNNVLWALITELWPIAVTISVANVLLMAANRWLGAFMLVWSIGFIAMSLFVSRRTQPLSYAASSARSHTVGLIVDAVSNHNAVRLFARVDHERKRLDAGYGDELQTVLRANLATERVRVFQFAASALLKGGIVVVSVALWVRGSISVGQFVMAVSMALLVIAEVRNLSRRFLEMFESLGNVASGVRAIFSAHELVDSPTARALPAVRGDIAFDAVGFRYAQGAEVFRGLTVHIPAGQHVGLVGVSGSGKSTFVSLLLRLYDPQSGAIRIDGHDLRDVTQDSLHEQIGLIPQDPSLFHRSLRENIRYGRLDASDAQVEDAARLAHAHDFIEKVPGGYDAQVGERGVKLSGGQRQRIVIARVLLKDAPVLILDEATSSLDSITEHEIQTALDGAMAGKTVVVVAHRLSTIAHLDRILVFSEGRIVEDGSHSELLAQRGAYRRLWSRQTGGLLPEHAEKDTGRASDDEAAAE